MRIINIAATVFVLLVTLTACGKEQGDLTEPTLSLDWPLDFPLNTPVNATTFHLSGTTEADATVTAYTNTEAEIVNLVSANGIWSFDVVNPEEGSNTVTVVSNDPSGNLHRLPVTIIYDATPPSVTLDQFASPSASTDQLLAGTVESGSQVRVLANNAAVVGTVVLNDTAWDCPVTLAGGETTITVIAQDVAGNVTTITQALTIANTLPLLTIDPLLPIKTSQANLSGVSSTTVPGLSANSTKVSFEPVEYTSPDWNVEASGFPVGKTVVTATVGDSPPTVEARQLVYYDNIAPLLVDSLPSLDRELAPEGTIRFKFNEQLDPATITSSTFTLKAQDSDELVPGSVTYDPQFRTATFQPDAPLTIGTTYTVTLATEVADLAGNVLAAALNREFTVAEGEPAAPLVIGTVPLANTAAADGITISATFSLAIDSETLADNFIVQDAASNRMAGEILYDPVSRLARFVPYGRLAVGSYSASLTTGITSVTGLPLANERTWTFTITAP